MLDGCSRNGILSKAIALRVAWRALHKAVMCMGSKADIDYYYRRITGVVVGSCWFTISNGRSTCYSSFLESSTQSKHGVYYIGSKADIGYYRRITVVVVVSWCTRIQIWPLVMKLLGRPIILLLFSNYDFFATARVGNFPPFDGREQFKWAKALRFIVQRVNLAVIVFHLSRILKWL